MQEESFMDDNKALPRKMTLAFARELLSTCGDKSIYYYISSLAKQKHFASSPLEMAELIESIWFLRLRLVAPLDYLKNRNIRMNNLGTKDSLLFLYSQTDEILRSVEDDAEQTEKWERIRDGFSDILLYDRSEAFFDFSFCSLRAWAFYEGVSLPSLLVPKMDEWFGVNHPDILDLPQIYREKVFESYIYDVAYEYATTNEFITNPNSAYSNKVKMLKDIVEAKRAYFGE